MKPFLFALVFGLSSIALSSEPRPIPADFEPPVWDVPNPEPPWPCELKGGVCVAVVPEACQGGRVTSDACGPEGVVGVQCCVTP